MALKKAENRWTLERVVSMNMKGTSNARRRQAQPDEQHIAKQSKTTQQTDFP